MGAMPSVIGEKKQRRCFVVTDGDPSRSQDILLHWVHTLGRYFLLTSRHEADADIHAGACS